MSEIEAGELWTVHPDASLQSVLDTPCCPPLLRRALTGVHSWQLRTQTTVSRTLRAFLLMPPWIAALLALGASVQLEQGDRASEVPLDRLGRETSSGDIAALHIPLPDSACRWGQAQVARTPADEPIVAAFAWVRLSGGVIEAARVALTGVWPEGVRLATPEDALVGEPLTVEQIRALAARIRDRVEPVGDYRGSERYRRAMADAMSRRALKACLELEGTDA